MNNLDNPGGIDENQLNIIIKFDFKCYFCIINSKNEYNPYPILSN
jgi:hypothetical protein